MGHCEQTKFAVKMITKNPHLRHAHWTNNIIKHNAASVMDPTSQFLFSCEQPVNMSHPLSYSTNITSSVSMPHQFMTEQSGIRHSES